MRPRCHTSFTYEFVTPDALTFIRAEGAAARIVPHCGYPEELSGLADAACVRRPTIPSDGLHLDCASYAIDDRPSENILTRNSILRRILGSLSVTAVVRMTCLECVVMVGDAP